MRGQELFICATYILVSLAFSRAYIDVWPVDDVQQTLPLPITKVRGGTLLHSLRNYSCYIILSVCKTIQIVWHSCQSARDTNTRRAATETVTATGWRCLATERLRWKATDSALKRGQKSDTSKQGRTSSETGTGAVHSASWKFNHILATPAQGYGMFIGPFTLHAANRSFSQFHKKQKNCEITQRESMF